MKIRGTATSHTWHSHVSHVAQRPFTRGTATSHTWHSDLSHVAQPRLTRGTATSHTWHCHVSHVPGLQLRIPWLCIYLSRCTFLAPDPSTCLPSVLILDFVLWGPHIWGDVVMMKLMLLLIFCWEIYGFGGGGGENSWRNWCRGHSVVFECNYATDA